MKKTISLVLCFVMVFGAFNLSGCVTEQHMGDEEVPTEEDSKAKFWNSPVGWVVVGLGAVVLIGLFVSAAKIAEADTPDDGIRMVSSEDEEVAAETSRGSIMDILQHIQVDVNQNNDVYVGFRFSY